MNIFEGIAWFSNIIKRKNYKNIKMFEKKSKHLIDNINNYKSYECKDIPYFLVYSSIYKVDSLVNLKFIFDIISTL